MSGFYTVAYAGGFRPWERAGKQAAGHFAALLDREQQDRPAPTRPGGRPGLRHRRTHH